MRELQAEGSSLTRPSRSEVARHEKKLKPLLIGNVLVDLAWVATFILDLGPLSLALFLAAVVQSLRLQLYVLKDLRLRGSSPLWIYAPGFGLIVWLIWRRSHPILT